MDVEPFPRMKLMKLYYLTLEEMKDLPDKYGKNPSSLHTINTDFIIAFTSKLSIFLGYKFLS